MDLTIRSFAFDDYDTVAGLWATVEGMHVPSRDEVVRKLERDPELFLVAESGGRLLGVVMGAYDGRRGWVFRLAVDATERARGIGRALIGELERRFLAMDVPHIRLLVDPGNGGGQAFWERMGYAMWPTLLGEKDLRGAADDDTGC